MYDLDNFVIQSNNGKIIEKKQHLNIFVPKFKELDGKFYLQPSFVVTKSSEGNDEHIDEVRSL